MAEAVCYSVIMVLKLVENDGTIREKAVCTNCKKPYFYPSTTGICSRTECLYTRLAAEKAKGIK